MWLYIHNAMNLPNTSQKLAVRRHRSLAGAGDGNLSDPATAASVFIAGWLCTIAFISKL